TSRSISETPAQSRPRRAGIAAFGVAASLEAAEQAGAVGQGVAQLGGGKAAQPCAVATGSKADGLAQQSGGDGLAVLVDNVGPGPQACRKRSLLGFERRQGQRQLCPQVQFMHQAAVDNQATGAGLAVAAKLQAGIAQAQA